MESLHNTTFDELNTGATLSVTRTLSAAEIDALGRVAGEPDVLHLDLGGPGPAAASWRKTCTTRAGWRWATAPPST